MTGEEKAKVRVSKVAWTLGLLGLAAAVPYAVPQLWPLRPLESAQLRKAWVEPFRGQPRTPVIKRIQPPPAQAPEIKPVLPKGTKPSPTAPRPWDPDSIGQVALEDTAGCLSAFFEALQRTEKGEAGAVTRISHFGDSPLTGDLISGEARSRLQKQFGNAGHGWMMPGRPWEWYNHNGVELKTSGWRPRTPLLGGGFAGLYGLAGVAFASEGSPAKAGFQFRKGLEPKGSFKVRAFYLQRPQMGKLILHAGEREPHVISTSGAETTVGENALRLEDIPRQIQIQAQGDATLYGLSFESEGPGLIYDSLGANGGSIHFLASVQADNWVQNLGFCRPHLVILGYGTNESGYFEKGGPPAQYGKDFKEVIQRIRRVEPTAAILIMAPMDRGVRNAEGEIVTLASIPRLVEAQRQIAHANGVAFFDTFRAMGGEGTMARWYASSPRLVSGDFTHPTKTGADQVARLLVEALQRNYTAYKYGRRHLSDSPPLQAQK